MEILTKHTTRDHMVGIMQAQIFRRNKEDKYKLLKCKH